MVIGARVVMDLLKLLHMMIMEILIIGVLSLIVRLMTMRSGQQMNAGLII